jgi:hypothetical protein
VGVRVRASAAFNVDSGVVETALLEQVDELFVGELAAALKIRVH